MEAFVIAREHIAGIIQAYGRDQVMDRVIDRLREAFRRAPSHRGTTPARAGFARVDVGGVIEWMPYYQPDHSVTIKTVAYSPLNPARHGLPTVTGMVARFDDATGALTAVTDGVFLTAIRTGAASAIASELLARPESRVLGLVGAGAQAVTQAHALSRVLPLTEVLVFDVDPTHAKSFGERTEFLPCRVTPTELPELEARADVICTVTSVGVAGGPVITGTDLQNHVHINAVGADLPGKFELPLPVLRRAVVVPDHLEQALREGECQQLPEATFPYTLFDLCRAPQIARACQDRLTVFDSTGFAFEDHFALDALLEVAAEVGIGDRMRMEYLPSDALDPYSLPVAVGRSRFPSFSTRPGDG